MISPLPPFSWTVPAPLAVRSWLLFSVSVLLHGQMHTNAFRSPQDKAWKSLPHRKNVSSPPARVGVRPTLHSTPLDPPCGLEICGPNLWHFLALGAGEQPWHPPLVFSICKIPCFKGSLVPAGLRQFMLKVILWLRRKSLLARVPTSSATSPAASELGSDTRLGSSFHRPLSLLPFSSRRALAEVLLSRSASQGVQLVNARTPAVP